MTDFVNHPPHYTAYSIEVIEVTRHCSFNIGNAIKYMLRHLHKGSSKQDLEKALWYLNDHREESMSSGPFREERSEIMMTSDMATNLLTLAIEYSEQEFSLPEVSKALSFLAIGNVKIASYYLSDAVEKIS